MLGGERVYTDGKVIGSDEGIKQGLSDDKVLGTIPGNLYVITRGIDVGTELGPFDGSLDRFNYGKF